jgi:serine/threonine protein kinase
VKENLFTTDEAARQFRLEAIILANLRHPNLPRVTDHFTLKDRGQYLVMDFIEGEDLRERMERVGTIPEDDVIVIGAAICDALTYLHTRTPTIIHRDIKPGNVKIAPNGHIVLRIWLAKVVQGTRRPPSARWRRRATAAGTIRRRARPADIYPRATLTAVGILAMGWRGKETHSFRCEAGTPALTQVRPGHRESHGGGSQDRYQTAEDFNGPAGLKSKPCSRSARIPSNPARGRGE